VLITGSLLVVEGMKIRWPKERERERTCYRTCEKKEEEQEPPLGSPKDRNQLVSTQCRSFCTWSGHFLIAFLFKDQVFLLLDARDYYYYEVKGAGNSTQ
jgi:hypothetical protein